MKLRGFVMGGTSKIIIAHSNLDFCDNFAQHLEKCGFDVSVVKSSKDIIKKSQAAGVSYDLIGVPLEEMTVADASIFEKFMSEDAQTESKVFAIIASSTRFSQVVLEKIKTVKPRDFITETSSKDEIVFRLNNIIFETKGVRKNFRAVINLAVHCDYMQDFFETESFTLSRDGIFLKTDRSFEKDSRLFMTFNLPSNGKNFATMGNVLYSISKDSPRPRITPPGLALYFVDLDGDERETIDRYIRGTA
jgi:hypothetical protein